MRDHERRIDLSFLHQREQVFHVTLHVRLPHLQRHPFVEHRTERHLVQQAAIHAGDRQHAALAHRAHRLPQRIRPVRLQFQCLLHVIVGRTVRLHPDGIDRRIGSAAASEFAQGVQHVVAVLDRDRARRLRHRQPLRHAIDRIHLRRAEQQRAADGELAHRSATPHRHHRVARPDVAIFRRHVAGRKNIRQEQHLLVRQIALDHDRPVVGKRHPRILRLPACVAPGHVRIAVKSRWAEPHQLLRHPRIRIRVVAQRPLLPPAMRAAAAGNRERHHHAVADAQSPHRRPHLDHLAHELVAQNVTFLHRRHVSII